MLKSYGVSLLIVIAAGASSARAAFDGDLVPRLSNGAIVTDGLSDLDGSFASNIQIFQYTLGDISPGYTEDPGFQPQTTSGLPGSSFLGFNVLGSLMFWNGSGQPDFTPAPASASFELYFGASHVFLAGASSAQNGFVIQELTSDGAGHRHLNAQALGAPDPAGLYLDSLGNPYDAPPDGIYAFQIQATDSLTQTTNPAAYASGPLWLVYNQGLTDDQLTAAADSLPTPEPASLALLALGASALFTRRHKP